MRVMGRVLTLLAVAVAVAGCGNGENGLDDTLPTIAPVSTTSTSSTTSTTVTIPITAAATAVATTSTTAAPTTTTTAASTTTVAPSTTAATTTTLPTVTPTLTALACTGAQLGADTGGAHAEPTCLAGWAVEQPPCTGPCETALVYHATGAGWVADGEVSRACAAALTEVGMPPDVAETFALAPCPGDPTGGTVVDRGDSGDVVVGVQVALVNRGYDIEVDGRFGPATDSAVRHFQTAAALESDGRVGPETQAVLFAP